MSDPESEKSTPATTEGEAKSSEIAKRDTLRFRTGIAIAVVSMLGAVVAWRASIVSSDASDLNQFATQELAEQQQILARHQNEVNQDIRLLASFQEHAWLEKRYRDDAKKVKKSSPDLAKGLQVRANGEAGLKREVEQFFLGGYPAVDDAKATASYSSETALRELADQDARLAELRPVALSEEAAGRHRQALQLVGVGAIFVVALFFLTIAQLAELPRGTTFGLIGGAVAVIGLLLFVFVGLF